MKLTINVFLLKAGRSLRDALSDEVRLDPISFSLPGVECISITKQTHPIQSGRSFSVILNKLRS